jgi:3-oxoacyl-[acyl-carrier protein] reductase
MYKNKVVLITGASRGVGLNLVKHFIKNKASVIGISRSESDFTDPCYSHFSVDLADPEAVIKMFKREIQKQFKKIDIVINNAAVLTSQYSMVLPMKNAIDMVNVNLLGVFFISREAVKLMRNNDAGRIINIGSMAVSLEPIGDALYAATKAAINTLANVMAKEFSNYNVTCNTLSISAIDTDMLHQHSDIARLKIDEIINNLPVPRKALMDDVLNVVDFYASDRSSYITAQTIYLGGVN